MLRTLSVAVLLVGVVYTGVGQAQQDWASVQVRTTDLGGGVYMLMGRGGNLGLSVGEDGAFLIDDQFAPLTEKIQAAIEAVSNQPVAFVLNTHFHSDHTGGNENFGKAGAMIVAHQNVRRRLNPAEFREVIGRTQQAPPEALPVITFTDEVDFYWNAQQIRAVHVPHAHTDGDAVILFSEANVIHMGDTFFNRSYPFIDVASGGGIDGVIHATQVALDLSNSSTKIIPGHGALATPDDLRAYRNMLITVRDRVHTMIREGHSEDEVVAAAPTRDLDATWGERAERLVRAVYQSLSNR